MLVHRNSENLKILLALPHLFIVIDEFAEVIAQCSEFKEMIISLSKVVLLEEESRRHYFSGDIVTSNDHEYLKEWAEQLKENTVVIIDYPGLAGNDCGDYTNLKMYPWQEVLRDKMAAGKMLIIWIEHVSRARNNSFFSDAISSYQKRIAMGGRGERHPYFSDRLDSSNIYLDSADAFVSLDGGDCMVVRTMIDV